MQGEGKAWVTAIIAAILLASLFEVNPTIGAPVIFAVVFVMIIGASNKGYLKTEGL